MFVEPVPSWQHRDSFVVDAFIKKILPSIYVPLLEPFTLVWCCILLWLLVDLEVYLFERTFPVSLCCLVQVVTSSYTVQDRSIPENCIYHHGAQLTSMVKPWSPSDCSLCNGPAPVLMCSSDESPPGYSHSSKYALFKVSPVGIQNYVQFWCGTIASFWTRQSRPSLFSPRVCTFSMVQTIACCPYH